MSDIKLIIGLAVAIALSVGASLFWNHYSDLVTASKLSEARKETAINTTATIDDGVVAEKVAQEVARVLSTNRTTFTDNQTKAKANEPETASRAVRTVPVSVRNNYAERRRARERLGCVRVECETGNPAGDAAKR